jgi:hypothetical protein
VKKRGHSEEDLYVTGKEKRKQGKPRNEEMNKWKREIIRGRKNKKTIKGRRRRPELRRGEIARQRKK